jgi:uncharacterized protein YjlB
VETSQFLFPDDGSIPNNPRLPLIIHAGAFAPPASGEAIRRIEERIAANGWSPAWQNGIYPFPHYHATCHEALVVARGWGRVRFGGRHGVVLKIGAGDVAVLPAGTGHQAIALSDDFMVIGAYPDGAGYDLCRGTAQEHAAAHARIATVPTPELDPVLGTEGGVATLWR